MSHSSTCPPSARFSFRVFVSLISFIAASVALCAEEEAPAETVVAVSVGKVVRTTLHAYVTAYGTVASAPAGGADRPSGGARLAAASPGLVVAVPGMEGAWVEEGAVLVQLDSAAADASITRAQTMVASAEKALDRQTRLQAADGTSERAVQEAVERLATARGELEAAKFELSLLAIRAPISGTISWLSVRPGEWLDAGREVVQIFNLDRLVVTAQVPSTEAALLQSGQSAKVFTRLGSAEKHLAQARLEFISPQVVAGSDQVAIRLALPEASGLRPGQFVVVLIVADEHVDRLAVPRASVYTDGSGRSTLSIVEGDVARQKVVQIGLFDGDWVEVSGEGVTEGATVVTLGSYALPEETKVHVLDTTGEGAK